MMEALGSSKMSVLIRAAWGNIPEDGIFHSRRRENLKFYIEGFGQGNMLWHNLEGSFKVFIILNTPHSE
jgi:hypothetical protein